MTAWYMACALFWSVVYGHQERRERKHAARLRHTTPRPQGARE